MLLLYLFIFISYAFVQGVIFQLEDEVEGWIPGPYREAKVPSTDLPVVQHFAAFFHNFHCLVFRGQAPIFTN